jgi:transmembrane sensor
MTDQKQELGSVQREAVFWYWQIQDPDLPRSEWHRFWEWSAIPEHREAFDAMAAVWERASGTPPVPHSTATSTVTTRRRLPRVLASVAIALLLMLALVAPISGPSVQIFQTQDTAEAWVLDDGSIVRAAPHTRLEVMFGEQYRSSYLERGQAFFLVVHDAARPFVVHTPAASVQAIGTRFGVTCVEGTSIVTVTEGTVSVSRGAQPIETSTRAASPSSVPLEFLHAGQQARVSSATFNRISHVDSGDALAWAKTIHFVDTPADQAVEQFNRLSGSRLELSNPSGKPVATIQGTFQFDDPRFFAETVANETSLRVLLHKHGSAAGEAPEIVLPYEEPSIQPVAK